MIKIIDAHEGEDHITSDDSRRFNAATLGNVRAVVDGMGVQKTGNNALSIADGLALIDGARIRVEGAESVEVPDGTIGKRRVDVVYIVYERTAQGVESVRWHYVTGTPAVNQSTMPENEHPGSILANDALVWVPFVRIDLNGLTVGNPQRLIPAWTWPPTNANNAANLAQMQAAIAQAAAMAAYAQEQARLANSAYQQLSDLVVDHARIWAAIDDLRETVDSVGGIAAALLGTWFFSKGVLYAPRGWVTVTSGDCELQGAVVSGTDVVLTSEAAPISALPTTNEIKSNIQQAAQIANPSTESESE